jgi:hypothetical protein
LCDLGHSFYVTAPNATAREEYLGALREQLDPEKQGSLASVQQSFSTLIMKGDPNPFLESLAESDFLISRWDYGGSDVFDPEASFKAVLLMFMNLVRGTYATLRNEVHYRGEVQSSFGHFSDITLLPTDASKPGIILEVKNVTVAALFPMFENWNEKIDKAKEELLKKSNEELLQMDFKDHLSRRTTIKKVLEDALVQVEIYRQKAEAQYPRQSGYLAWVIIRVGLLRFLAYEK